MTTSNNSGNSSTGGTIVITSTNGGQWITVPNPWVGGTITVGPQISFDDIDLAVPVEEKENKSDGCSCKKCKEFFEYAEPNQEDGTLICWACRHGY